jgi:hypothetical protein
MHRLYDNIKILYKETGCDGMERIHLGQEKEQWLALLCLVMNLWVP